MIVNVQRGMTRLFLILGLAVAVGVAYAGNLTAQVQPNVLTVARGTSQLVTIPITIDRVSIGDPAIADAVVVSPQEIVVNALTVGTTSLFVWDIGGTVRNYTIEVTIDASALQRQVDALFPGQNIVVTAAGDLVIFSGSVSDAGIGNRVLEIARGTGATVVNNLQVPPAQQILLSVRFAEVSRRALERLGADFLAGRTSAILNPLAPVAGDIVAGSSLSDGLVELFLFEDDVQVNAVVDALRRSGTFRSLAEPNLLALEGQEASFLAGGEFPYPVPQASGGASGNTITVEFKEFGVRLRFVPNVTIAGNIRLQVAPEVSSLDFANGIQFSGFNVPALLTRRAETSVELRDGQTLAIAGLIDNNTTRTVNKVPFLGDIPLLGALFRSREVLQNRSELLVLVTPRIVTPSDVAPPLPTGEPETWDWSRDLETGIQ